MPTTLSFSAGICTVKETPWKFKRGSNGGSRWHLSSHFYGKRQIVFSDHCFSFQMPRSGHACSPLYQAKRVEQGIETRKKADHEIQSIGFLNTFNKRSSRLPFSGSCM